MKIFWASLFLFSCILIGTVYNARYIHRTAGEIQMLVESMDTPADSLEAISKLETFWEENRSRVEWTTGRRRVQPIDEQLVELKWAILGNRQNEFEKHRTLLIDVTKELIHQESLTWDSVF